jgi:hypothetical protein
MLISLDWIRDYVDLPRDLDPRALAERFTRTTAEVDRELDTGTCRAIFRQASRFVAEKDLRPHFYSR